MKQFSVGDVYFWLGAGSFDSSERYKRTPEEEAELHLNSLVQSLDPKEATYMELYGRSIKRPNTAFLCAHGVEHDKSWHYMDGKRSLSVQSWIDKVDGQYGTLVIGCCNPQSETPRAQKSLLLIPDQTYSIRTIDAGIVNLSLIHPTEGELDHTIEYMIREAQAVG